MPTAIVIAIFLISFWLLIIAIQLDRIFKVLHDIGENMSKIEKHLDQKDNNS